MHGGFGFSFFMAEIKELRSFALNELRASGGKNPKIRGHAAVFNQLSDDIGGFREKITPGAFADTIKNGDVRALWNHDSNYPLARTKNGTLRLEEDDVGLRFEADLLDEPFEAGLIRRIDRGDVNQMSFGFMVLPDGQKWSMEGGGLVRTLTKVELFDVSPVTYPAYPQTDLSVRNLAIEMRKTLETAPAKPIADSDFLRRSQARMEFLSRREPQKLTYSLSDILKNARKK